MKRTGTPLHLRLTAGIASIALWSCMLPTAALANDVTTPTPYINESGTIDGNVTVDDGTYGVMASGREEGAVASVDVTGDVTNATKGAPIAYGAVSEGRDGGSGQLDVGGNVTTSPKDDVDASANGRGLFVTVDGGSARANVSGDVLANATTDSIGVEARAYGKDTDSVAATVDGTVTATSTRVPEGRSNRSYAVDAQASDQSSALVQVAGDLVSKAYGADSAAMGVNVYSEAESSTIVEVEGDVRALAEGGAYGGSLYTTGGVARLVVGGDIVTSAPSDGVSVGMALSSKDAGTPELVVQGTIHASTTGIEVEGDEGATFDVTVWKIEVGEGGSLVDKVDAASVDTDSVASQIKYIIKVEQPEAGGTLSAVGSLKGTLAQSFGFDVAHAGDKVYLDVALEDGYFVSGAYNGQGKKIQLMHDEGGYYVIVPDGGGVYLTAELGKVEPTPAAEKPMPRPAVETAPEEGSSYATPVASAAVISSALPATADTQSPLFAVALALAGAACVIAARRPVAEG